MHQVLFKYPRFEALVAEVIQLQQRLGLDQISVQTTGVDDWQQSAGWLKNGFTELEFDKIHPQLVNTELSAYLTWLPFKVTRTRVMAMPPGRQYSIHKDSSRRLHLPLTTNPESLFIFTEDSLNIHMPADGHLHVVDTRKMHTAINGGQSVRIHIVSVIPPIMSTSLANF